MKEILIYPLFPGRIMALDATAAEEKK